MSWCAAQVYDIYEDIGYLGDAGFPHLDAESNAEIIYPDLNPRGTNSIPTETRELVPEPPDQLPLLNQAVPFSPSRPSADSPQPLGPPPPPRRGRGEAPGAGDSSPVVFEAPVRQGAGLRRLPPARNQRVGARESTGSQ